MPKARTSLLTEADLELIRRFGAPSGIRSDLVVETGAEPEIAFTVKGIQFYAAACKHCGVRASLNNVTTKLALLKLGKQLLDVLIRRQANELERQLESGTINPINRETVRTLLHGTPGAWARAVQKRRECGEAGDNVIPVMFAK